ncbi:arginine-tRNA-protein transferase [Neorhodopirellula lusitana]|uniref:Arginine-tRNA-protein transferase n=1 Tax=Neorhodopirellula lusitana TaxID=445327 RepID=A0ABY1PZ03_9BACT|nr:arginyltransferase [Neorhodopirellula lusitana]SMP48639.1 arginine-tRNA-protein transferase [Neorhodopirellula lusitana]
MSAINNDGFPAHAEPLREHLLPIQDTPSACPYIDGVTARMPLFYPVTPLSGEDVDWLLAAGFRRSGNLVYFTKCAPCHACEPTRLDVAHFQLSSSFRRVLKRAAKDLTLSWRMPSVDDDRVRLYNMHREGRNLASSPPIDAQDYHAFLTETCWPSLELEMKLDEQLVGISIMDVGQESVSAVYTHFDPQASRYSLGTLAVLLQIQWAQQQTRRWVYLGLYVESNSHLNYKARYQPQERLISGQWQAIEPT